LREKGKEEKKVRLRGRSSLGALKSVAWVADISSRICCYQTPSLLLFDFAFWIYICTLSDFCVAYCILGPYTWEFMVVCHLVEIPLGCLGIIWCYSDLRDQFDSLLGGAGLLSRLLSDF